MSDDQMIEQAIARAAEIGAEHGENAASWWDQDAIGGRSQGDPVETAKLVLQGIDDGDPMVLDSLPAPDLSGEWADGYTPRRLLEDVGDNDGDASFHEGLVDDLCRAYEDAFYDASLAAIVRSCELVIA
jgi:hypothetical protein